MRRLVLGSAALLMLAGCAQKVVLEEIHSSEKARVMLRRTLDDGEPVPRGYEHPVIIADVRIAHILATLFYENRKGERSPAFRTLQIYELAEGLAKAFKAAGPDDEIVAASFGIDRRLGIFTEDRVTSFRAWFREGLLQLDFYAIEQLLEEPGVSNEAESYRVPSEPPSRPSFRIIPAEAMVAAGRRGVLIDWRNPTFRRPVTLAPSAHGLRRRTVLMETEEEPVVVGPPEGLSDAQLQALDELDGARRSGLIHEVEFQRRRRLILEGELEEAGYGGETP